MLISELKTKGEPFQCAQHKSGNWWIEVDPDQKIDGVVEGEFLNNKEREFSLKKMAKNPFKENSFLISIQAYYSEHCYIPYIPRKTTRQMTAKEVWELWKSNQNILVKRKGLDYAYTINGFDLKCIDRDQLLINRSWESIEYLIYTLDFGETWQKFEVTENG